LPLRLNGRLLPLERRNQARPRDACRRLSKRGRPEDASDVRSVVVDANVLVCSLLTAMRGNATTRTPLAAGGSRRDRRDRSAVRNLRSHLRLAKPIPGGYIGDRLASLIRDIIAFPGVHLIDDCPWKQVMEVWPDPFRSTDRCRARASPRNRYDAIATFDRKAREAGQDFGVAAFW